MTRSESSESQLLPLCIRNLSSLHHLRLQVLLLCMRAPRSYTCEDVVELHVHGGGVCASRVLQV